jgi:hypothetical protein
MDGWPFQVGRCQIRRAALHDGREARKETGVGPGFLHRLTDPARTEAGTLYDFG